MNRTTEVLIQSPQSLFMKGFEIKTAALCVTQSAPLFTIQMRKSSRVLILTSLFKMDEKDIVIVKAEGKCFSCNRWVLIEMSSYFKDRLSKFGEGEKKEIELRGINKSALQFILERVPAQVELCQDPVKVLEAASALSCEKEVELSLQFLMSEENRKYIPTMVISKKLNYRQLYERSRAYCLWRFRELAKTKDFLNMSFIDIYHYLNDERLYCNTEMEIFHSILKWINYKPGRDNHGLDLVKTIRFKLLTASQIKTFLPYAFVKESAQITTFISCIQALKENKMKLVCPECTHYTSIEYKHIPHAIGIPCLCSILDNAALISLKNALERTRNVPLLLCLTTLIHLEYSNIQYPCAFIFDGKDVTKKWFFEKIYCNNTILVGYKIVPVDFKLFVLGGEWGEGRYNSQIWAFDTVHEKWNLESEIPYPRTNFFACGIGTVIYLVGGSTGHDGNSLNNITKYDTVTGEWTECVKIKVRKFDAVCSDRRFIYFANNDVYYYDTLNGHAGKLKNFCGTQNEITFLGAQGGYLYYVYLDGEGASVGQWKLLCDPSLSSENPKNKVIAKFKFKGHYCFTSGYLYSLTGAKDICIVEQLCLSTHKLVEFTTVIEGFDPKNGFTCFSFPSYV